jgi:hypothetical protein
MFLPMSALFACVKNAPVTSGKPLADRLVNYLLTICNPNFDAKNGV